MKYLVLAFIVIGAISAAAISQKKDSLSDRITQNFVKIYAPAVEAQAFATINAVDPSMRVSVSADDMMSDLSSYAYGDSVKRPLLMSDVSVEGTIYGMQGNWMSIISLKCEKGRNYLSEQLYSHRVSGFRYSTSDKWVENAKTMCGI